jgi:two-component system KDP operon response regulator KdpE
MTRVLLVDDDPALVRALSINLKARGYEVDVAYTGARALELAGSRLPDVIVLDLPVLVLSAREEQAEKVAALDAGADDYVIKPFGMDELLARLRAALRRAAPVSTDVPVIVTSHFTVDLSARRVTRPDGEVRLTPTEWHLLELLVRSPGRLLTQRQLLQEVWGPAYQSETNYLRVYIAQLRRKLEPEPSRPVHLITEPGLGYRFEP